MRDTDIKTDVDLMRENIRHAMWNIEYHEEKLKKAHAKVAFAKALMQRAEFDFTNEEAEQEYEEHDDDENYDDCESFAKCILGGALRSVYWHEQELSTAHNELAAAKMLFMRGKFTEPLIEEAKAKLAKEKEEQQEEAAA